MAGPEKLLSNVSPIVSDYDENSSFEKNEPKFMIGEKLKKVCAGEKPAKQPGNKNKIKKQDGIYPDSSTSSDQSYKPNRKN